MSKVPGESTKASLDTLRARTPDIDSDTVADDCDTAESTDEEEEQELLSQELAECVGESRNGFMCQANLHFGDISVVRQMLGFQKRSKGSRQHSQASRQMRPTQRPARLHVVCNMIQW